MFNQHEVGQRWALRENDDHTIVPIRSDNWVSKINIGRVELDRSRWYLREPSHCAYKDKPSLVPFLPELLFLAERFGICQGDVTQMVLSTLLSQLQMVGQKHTSKDYVPHDCGFVEALESPFQSDCRGALFGTIPKQSKPAHSIESRSFSLRWVVSLFPLPKRSDRPSRKSLSLLQNFRFCFWIRGSFAQL